MGSRPGFVQDRYRAFAAGLVRPQGIWLASRGI